MFELKKIIVFFALLCFTVVFAACGGSSTTTTSNSTATSKPAENKVAEKPAENKTTASAADEIGVPECDEYIKKYEACVMNKVPEAQRATFKSSLEQMRSSWKQAAANPQTKSALAAGCKTAADTAKQSLSAFSCEW